MHRKRLSGLLFLLLALSGCGAMTIVPHTEPVSPPLVTIFPEEQPAPSSSACTPDTPDAPAEAAPATTATETTEPEATHSPFRSGDTTLTWRPELEQNYPLDEACNAALLLEKWMAIEGLTMDDLNRRDCRQLILVAAQPEDGVRSMTVCYEREGEDSFRPVPELEDLQGFVGKNGIMHDRKRNTETTPAGLWQISSAFGNELPPDGLKLPWRQVTPCSDWVCDDSSPYFNTWQERGDPDLTPWSDDVEHLADYPFHYAWACVLEYNRPPDVIPARGCAIFLHVADGGTGGCVGLQQADMLSVLNWLDIEKQPYILITGHTQSSG